MQVVFVCVGFILAIFFFIQLKRGEQYEWMVQNLDENEYPLNTLYSIGFAWSSMKVFRLKGKISASLHEQASLLYEPQYAEYYANIAWAQMLTLIHLFATVTFLLSGIMYESVILIFGAGVFLCILIGVYALQNMKNMLSKRTEECEIQLPEVVSTMAVLVNSGMVLHDAWNMIAENGTGPFYDLMKKISENMRNGLSDADAILQFGKVSNSSEIKKFTSALIQSMDKGGAELATFLAQQSSELWNEKRQRMLQSGEKAATKLLLPIVLIFVGIIIIVMTAAFAGSLF